MTIVRKWTALALACLLLGWAGTAAAAEHRYGPNTTGTVPGLINDGWNSGNAGVTVSTDDPLLNALYEAGNLGDGVAGDLTITSEGPGDAGLIFGENTRTTQQILDSDGNVLWDNVVLFEGDATLTGWWNGDDDDPEVGRAMLFVQDGAVVLVAGTTTLDDFSALTISGGLMYTNALDINGKDAELVVQGNGDGDHGALIVKEQTTISEGTLTVGVGGEVYFLDDVMIGGERAELNMAGGAIDLSGGVDPLIPIHPDYFARVIALDEGGRLIVSAGDNYIGDTVHDRGSSTTMTDTSPSRTVQA